MTSRTTVSKKSTSDSTISPFLPLEDPGRLTGFEIGLNLALAGLLLLVLGCGVSARGRSRTSDHQTSESRRPPAAAISSLRSSAERPNTARRTIMIKKEGQSHEPQ